MKTINLADKFALIDDHWSPRIVGELNGQYVKLVKVRGEFIWHQHDQEDELFLVIRGELTIELQDRSLVLRPGEFAIIPRGTPHRPMCDEETQVLLLEPKSTINTGGEASERRRDAEWI